MNKKELIQSVSDISGVDPKTTEAVINVFTDVVKQEVEEEREVQIRGVGKFFMKTMAERNGINPKTKERIVIKGQKKMAFKSYSSIE